MRPNGREHIDGAEGPPMKYTEDNRGIIQDTNNFHQKVLFGGMKYGKCMPTDIDAVMEFDNKLLIIFELKYGDAPIPTGQNILLTRLVDAWQQDGREAVLFLCRHMTPNTEDIQLANTSVTDVYYKGRWVRQKIVKRAKERTDEVIRWAEQTHGWSLTHETIRTAVL